MNLIEKASEYWNGKWSLTSYAADVKTNFQVEGVVEVPFAVKNRSGVFEHTDRMQEEVTIPDQEIDNSRLDETVKGQWNRIFSRPLFANTNFYDSNSGKGEKVRGFFKARVLVAGHLLLAIPKAFVDVLSKIAFIAEKAFATLTTLFKGEFKEAKIQFTACANAVGALALRPIVLGLDLIKLSAGLLCIRAAVNFKELSLRDRIDARIDKKEKELAVPLAIKRMQDQNFTQSGLSTNGALEFIRNPNSND